MVVMVRTPVQGAMKHAALERVDELEWRLRQVEGVETTQSLASLARQTAVAMNEGNPRWYELQPNQAALNTASSRAPRNLVNSDFSLLQVQIYLTDHKAQTLRRVSAAVEAFAKENDSTDAQFLLAAGNAGFEAATNAVVEKANHEMLLLVYAAVVALAYLTFRSWRAVACAIIPLALTSDSGRGADGVAGDRLESGDAAGGGARGRDRRRLRAVRAQHHAGADASGLAAGAGLPSCAAVYRQGGHADRYHAGAGRGDLGFSPIKFQADMGILLAFMFIVNMIGALVLLPALACFLLKPQTQAVGKQAVAVAAGDHAAPSSSVLNR